MTRTMIVGALLVSMLAGCNERPSSPSPYTPVEKPGGFCAFDGVNSFLKHLSQVLKEGRP